MIVIDVGCAKWGGDESVSKLVEEFHPDVLYGFDPGLNEEDYPGVMGDTELVLSGAAAWTFDGELGFRVANLGGQVDVDGKVVPCVDLAAFILALPEGDVVLKVDAEGAEYELVPHLVAHDADLRLSLAVIEFHCEVCRMGIWDNDLHREWCDTDMGAWVERRDATLAMLRCAKGEWAS